MSTEIEEREEKEFEMLLLEKRHKEILRSLTSIAEGLSKKNDEELAKLISTQGDKLEMLSKHLLDFKMPSSEISFKTDSFESFFENIKNEIVNSNQNLINTLENRPLPFSFDLERGYGGVTTSVKVNYKTAKEINYNK